VEVCKVERIVDSKACESTGLCKGEKYLLGVLLEVMIQSIQRREPRDRIGSEEVRGDFRSAVGGHMERDVMLGEHAQ